MFNFALKWFEVLGRLKRVGVVWQNTSEFVAGGEMSVMRALVTEGWKIASW